MNKLVTVINWFFDFLNSAFNYIFTGKPAHTPRPYPREYEGRQAYPAPERPLHEIQTDLSLESDVPPEYRKNKSLLTYRERVLYRALRKANDNTFLIMSKVRMGDFIYLANEPKDRKFHNNQILCKHVDFLLCDKGTLEPLLVVELDDSSHRKEDHVERDKFKDATFTAVGLPFLRVELQEDYDSRQLWENIKEKIGDKHTVTH